MEKRIINEDEYQEVRQLLNKNDNYFSHKEINQHFNDYYYYKLEK